MSQVKENFVSDRVKSMTGKAGAAVATSLASVSAFAAGTGGDHTAAITAASDGASTNVAAAVAAVITIAAIVMGVGIVLRLLNR